MSAADTTAAVAGAPSGDYARRSGGVKRSSNQRAVFGAWRAIV